MPAKLVDIARAVGVTEITVRRALSGKGYVRSDTRERILKVAKELNYRPNRIARSLAMGKSGLIGVVVSSKLVVHYHMSIEPTERAIREAGYSMLLYTHEGNSVGEQLCLEQLILHRVDGAIVYPCETPADNAAYKDVLDSGIKMVLIDRSIPDIPVPQILTSPYMPSRLATDYLISLGHRDIVYLAIPQTSDMGRERARGFRDAMAAAGIPVRKSSIVETAVGPEYGWESMSRLLERKEPPTAVIARHDLVAQGAMGAIFAAGLSVPEDISVVGNGDLWPEHLLRVPLTTIRHPAGHLYKLGMQKLLAMLDGEQVDPKISIEDIELVVRASCAPPRTRK